MWLIAAILSSFFAGITSVLAKCGIRKTDSDIVTALRTIVVLICPRLWFLPSALPAQSRRPSQSHRCF